jgi:hypothetical protein
MHEWLYKILDDLPHVPQELIDRAYAKINTELEQMPSNSDQKIDWTKITTDKIIVDGVEKTNAPNLAYGLDEDVRDWVHKNITDRDIANIRIAATNTTAENDTNGAHCDLSRNYTLLYLLESGGPDHRTVFYREHGQPLWRKNGDRCNDHSKLDIVDSLQVPLRRWTLITTRVLHGVRNIPTPRISIQVGLNSVESLGVE